MLTLSQYRCIRRTLLLFIMLLSETTTQRLYPCESLVYCQGEVLALIQSSGVFNSSKQFVDRPLRVDPDQFVQEILHLKDSGPNNFAQLLREYLYNTTSEEGSDLDEWDPSDWVQRPTFTDDIANEELKQWALDLNSLWRTFGKQVNSSVVSEPDRHSLLPVPNPFIVPGGRFREYYYWDSFWVVKGLLLCEMYDTVRFMIENLATLIDQYGMVPNGGRIYYTRRSQPPLLTQMVSLYFEATQDFTLLSSVLPRLVREYEFWMDNRTVEIADRVFLNRYDVAMDTERPESFNEDVNTVKSVDMNRRPEVLTDIASAAESGWDFSSRWFSRFNGSNNFTTSPSNTNIDIVIGNLSTIRTRSIVPVDLNAILCQNEATLAYLFDRIGDASQAARFQAALELRRGSFDDVFWNETSGMWLDWDLDNSAHLNEFYASSLVPLMWGCNPVNLTKHEATLNSLNKLGVLDYPGGIPTSLVRGTEQQWDFPNVWAPLQWFPVLAWYQSSTESLRDAAESIATRWLNTTWIAWGNFNKTMFEKYDCTQAGLPGEGGEYTVQSGFGWTNGVVLHFLSLYPNINLTLQASDQQADTTTTSSPTTPTTSTTMTTLLADTNTTTDNTTSPSPSPRKGRSLGWVAVIVLFVVAVAITIPCLFWCRWLYQTGETRYWGRVRNEHLVAAGGAGGGGGGGGGRRSPSSSSYDQRHKRDFSVETDDNDTREFFTWDV